MTPETSAADVLLVSADLFLGSRVRGAVESEGLTLETAGNSALAVERMESAKTSRLILVDLETPDLSIDRLMAARTESTPIVVAYGPHVHAQRLDAARAAGCDRVLTRGQFDRALPQLLRELLTDGSL